MRAPIALVVAAAALFGARAARAEATIPHPKYPAWFVPEGEAVKSFSLEMNPLALLIGVYSANVEFLAAPHHALVFTPSYTYANPGNDDEITGFGGEAGYRYYTGTHGVEGWFFGGGASLSELRYIHRTTPGFPASPANDTSYAAYGLFVDAGYQILLHEHVVLGLGGGLQYRFFGTQPAFETESHAHTDLVYGSGLRPRILATFGGTI